MFLLFLIVLSPWNQFMKDPMHTGKTDIVIPDTLEIGWVFNSPTSTPTWNWLQPVIDKEGNIYFSAASHFLSVDSLGNLRWSKYTSHSFACTPAIAGDTVYFTSSEGILFSCDLNGNELWTFSLYHPINSGITISSNGTLYIGDAGQNETGVLYSINPDGTLKWSTVFQNSTGWYTTPALSHEENTVYVTPGNWDLYAVNASDGNIKWSFPSEAAFNTQYSSPSVILHNDSHFVIFGDLGNFSGNSYWYAVKSTDGSEKWRVTCGNSIQNTASYDPNTGIIYLADNDGIIRAVDTMGNLKWTKGFGAVLSDIVIDGEGKIIFGTETGYIYIINGSNGEEIFSMYLGMPYSSTPVIGKNGKVYVIAGSHDLLCLHKKTYINSGIHFIKSEDFNTIKFIVISRQTLILQ
jgi:outer membrane protein assembly factor BamB